MFAARRSLFAGRHVKGNKFGEGFRLPLIGGGRIDSETPPTCPNDRTVVRILREERNDEQRYWLLRCLHHKIERARDVAFQILAWDHGVEHSVLQEKF